jgi:nucleoid-associated protein YgaU
MRRYAALLQKRLKTLEEAAAAKTETAMPPADLPAPAVASSSPPVSNPGTAPVSARPAAPSLPSEYTVQAGDSLMKISRKLYGTARHHELLFEANRSVLVSPSKLVPGQRLAVPSLSELNQEEEP